MNIWLGTNCIRNTNGVIRAFGRDLMTLEAAQEGPLLLSLDLVSLDGDVIAALRRNQWVTRHEAYELDVSAREVELFLLPSYDVILRARAVSDSEIEIGVAWLYVGRQDLVFGIDKGRLGIGKAGGNPQMAFEQNELDGRGGSIEITTRGIAVNITDLDT